MNDEEVNIITGKKCKMILKKKIVFYGFMLLLLSSTQLLAKEKDSINIRLDITKTPDLEKWAKRAQNLMIEWYPRIINLIPTKDHRAPKTITLKFSNAYKGVAFASGNTITVSSNWIKSHPKDIGLVIHELAHVIQGYPSYNPSWVVEGIADYIRWVIYEGQPQDKFHRPKKVYGYKEGYQVAAGFFLWLETEVSPGIVNKLNSAMRQKKYSDKIFEIETNKSLNKLWSMYTNKRYF